MNPVSYSRFDSTDFSTYLTKAEIEQALSTLKTLKAGKERDKMVAEAVVDLDLLICQRKTVLTPKQWAWYKLFSPPPQDRLEPSVQLLSEENMQHRSQPLAELPSTITNTFVGQ